MICENWRFPLVLSIWNAIVVLLMEIIISFFLIIFRQTQWIFEINVRHADLFQLHYNFHRHRHRFHRCRGFHRFGGFCSVFWYEIDCVIDTSKQYLNNYEIVHVIITFVNWFIRTIAIARYLPGQMQLTLP